MATILTGSNGDRAVIDDDGGSSPMMIQAQRQPARDTDCACADDGARVTFAAPEQCPNCHKAAGKCICTTDEVEHALALDIDGLHKLTAQWIATLQTQGRALDTARAHIRLLQAQAADNGTTLVELSTRLLQLEKRFLSLEGIAESTQATAAGTRSDLAELVDRVSSLELDHCAERGEL